MAGSIFISETNPQRLENLNGLDALTEFTYVALDSLITLDFQTIAVDGGQIWAEGDPIRFDADHGFAVFRVNPAGLGFVLQRHNLVKGKQIDLRKLAEFVRVNGVDNIYELATF